MSEQTKTTTHRSYTVAEIDRMRIAVFRSQTKGLSYMQAGSDGQWILSMSANWNTISIMPSGISDHIMRTRVEDMVRTYMLGGVSPEELEAIVESTP